MRLLLDRLEGSSSQIGALVGRCNVEIAVYYESYQCQMWGLHWDAETLRRVSKLGVDVDVDLYASGPDLPH